MLKKETFIWTVGQFERGKEKGKRCYNTIWIKKITRMLKKEAFNWRDSLRGQEGKGKRSREKYI